MVVDTSAIIAIIFREPEWRGLSQTAAGDAVLAISAVTIHEASVVAAGKKKDPLAVQLIDDFIRDLGVDVIPVGLESAQAARAAYLRFGKGYHAAGLNLADCFPYSLAKARNEPLLFKGADFLKTDIVPAWRP
jgi:ribonuclease VapC